MLGQGFEPPCENAGKTVISESGGPIDGTKTPRTDVEAIVASLPPERLAEVLAALVQPRGGQ
jgi:hypothetical protein